MDLYQSVLALGRASVRRERLALSAARMYAQIVGQKVDRALYQGFPMLGQARAQVWFYSPIYRRPRHFHAEPELNLVVVGSASFGIGGNLVEVVSGDVLAFPTGQDHVLLRASPDLVLYAIGMRDGFSSEVLRTERHAVALPLFFRPRSNEFQAIVRRAAAVAEQNGPDGQVAELWEHAHHSRCARAQGSDGAMHVLTRRTLSTITDAPELSRDALARETRANQTEISRHFHHDVGMTFVRYRTRLRLLRFIRLVDDRAGNLLAAAARAGFGSYSQCHRSFQAELGCAPREFFVSGLRERMEDTFEPLSLV
jgi:AraC-like DNA-binding protein